MTHTDMLSTEWFDGFMTEEFAEDFANALFARIDAAEQRAKAKAGKRTAENRRSVTGRFLAKSLRE